jgi:predicted kinase
VDDEVLDKAGLADPAERFRARSAARYFRIAARMTDPVWHAERLVEDAGRPRGTLHLVVGIAGCGKSRWAAENLAETRIVSSDQMREELTGSADDQHMNHIVFQRAVERIRRALHDGQEVSFDATNVSVPARSTPLKAARWTGARIVAHFFDIPLAVALERNERRDRFVPKDVILRHYRTLVVPRLYECDELNVVSAQGGEEKVWPA